MSTPSSAYLKLRLIILPFLLTSIGTIVGVSLLQWLLFAQTGWSLEIHDAILELFVPMVYAYSAVYFFMKSRLKLFDFESKKTRSVYQLVTWIAIMMPTVVAQIWVLDTGGGLTQLERISQIGSVAASKYYSLDRFELDTAATVMHSTAEIAGHRRSRTIDYTIHYVTPILDPGQDPRDSTAYAWLVTHYTSSVRRRADGDEKQRVWEELYTRSEREFHALDLEQFDYLERVGVTDQTNGFREAIDSSLRYRSNESVPLLRARHGTFEQRRENRYIGIIVSFVVGTGIFLLFVAFPSLRDVA